VRPIAPTDLIVSDDDGFAREAHPTHRRAGAIVVTGIFWTFNFVVLTLRNAIDHLPQWHAIAGARAVSMLIGCGFCYLMHLVMRRMGGRPFWQRALALAVMAPVAADALSWVVYLTSEAVAPQAMPLSIGAIIFNVFYWVWFFVAWAALYLALAYSHEVQAEQRRWSEMQVLAQAAQLRALRYQLHPHLIFNALNSISALVWEERREPADAMIAKLATFLRAAFAIDPLEEVCLDEELQLQKLYLDIEQVRFADFQFTIELPDELRDARLPSLILQPLVENAIKYAVATSDGPTRVTIDASSAGGRLWITVEDEGGGCPAQAGSGVGLENVRARLRHRFGDAASLHTERGGRGFRATVSMPLERGR